MNLEVENNNLMNIEQNHINSKSINLVSQDTRGNKVLIMDKKFQDALNKIQDKALVKYIKDFILTNKDKNDITRKPSNRDLAQAKFFLGDKLYSELQTFLESVGLNISRGGANDSIEMQLMRKEFKVFCNGLVKQGLASKQGNNYCTRDALGNEIILSFNLAKKQKKQQSTLKAS